MLATQKCAVDCRTYLERNLISAQKEISSVTADRSNVARGFEGFDLGSWSPDKGCPILVILFVDVETCLPWSG